MGRRDHRANARARDRRDLHMRAGGRSALDLRWSLARRRDRHDAGGQVPDQLVGRAVPPVRVRPVDVGYRGRAVPYWLGRLGQDKVEIARGFLARAARQACVATSPGLKATASTASAGSVSLASCRATLGTASGASVIDFDGTVESRVHDYLAEHPAATYDEVERALLHAYEGRQRSTSSPPGSSRQRFFVRHSCSFRGTTRARSRHGRTTSRSSTTSRTSMRL